MLIFLGDYIDRGKDSKLVVKKIRELQEHNSNVIALMGNHEDMLLNCLRGDDTWLYNGYNATLESYKGCFDELQETTGVFMENWLSVLMVKRD